MTDEENGPTSPSGATPTPTDGWAGVARRRPIPRKGHKKSRAGCLVCKGRKVKCDEVAPECGPCRRLGLGCRFTPGTHNWVEEVPPGGDVTLSRPLRTTQSAFGIEDLRFFQHFLFNAYPSLPVGGWEVWQQMGQMSHHYEFLVHAILGLGASHLGMLAEKSYAKEALGHRVRAIRTLNQHLAKSEPSITDSDAAFAAMLSLTFQSAYMPDGMIDFFSTIRGCFIIGSTLNPNFQSSSFKAFARLPYTEKVLELTVSKSDPSLDAAVAAGFCASLKRLTPLCQSVAELEYLAKMQRIATLAVTDPAESYHEHSFLYDKLGELSPEDYASFIDPNNHASRLVMMHILASEYVMSRKEVEEWQNLPYNDGLQKGFDCRKSMSVRWIMKILSDLPDKYYPYADWIARFVRSLSFSFQGSNEIWRPFLLHNGTATISDLPNVETLQKVYR